MNVSRKPVFEWRVRVYYEDTDAGGVVFYANYLKFFERARTEWLRATGIGQQTLMHTDQAMFVVKSTAVDYHAPARLDDVLRVTVSIERLGRASVQFVQNAWRKNEQADELIAVGKIRVGCVSSVTFKPVAIPQIVLAAIHIDDRNQTRQQQDLSESLDLNVAPPDNQVQLTSRNVL